MKQENRRLRSRAEVCGLANLASSFILSVCVNVRCGLANERKKQHRQTDSEQLRQTSSRILLASHLRL